MRVCNTSRVSASVRAVFNVREKSSVQQYDFIGFVRCRRALDGKEKDGSERLIPLSKFKH